MKRSVATLVAVAGFYAGIRYARHRRRTNLQDKGVLITGGSRGLGLALARVFTQRGANVALLARDADELRAAHDELQQSTTRLVITAVCDITDSMTRRTAVQMVATKFGRLDVLVNDAGVIQVGPLDHMEASDFDAAYAVHVRAPLDAMLAAREPMRRQGGGRIVNVASVGGLVAVPHMAPYTMSKFALVGLSDALRAELYRDNILVTTVCPGLMRTGSHIRARFKGKARAEYTWFTLGDAAPPVSIDAESAAEAIVKAVEEGKARFDLTWATKFARVAQGIAPNLVAAGARLATALLPNPSKTASTEEVEGAAFETKGFPPNVAKAADENNERTSLS